eukprot:scaffold112106_cov22-Tisochrysis_lutea.AAC.3
MPVVGHLPQAQRLAHVAQVENVLLEAGAAKADAGRQELVADAGVSANGVRYLDKRRAQCVFRVSAGCWQPPPSVVMHPTVVLVTTIVSSFATT